MTDDSTQILNPSASLEEDYSLADDDVPSLARSTATADGFNYKSHFLALRRCYMNEKLAPELLFYKEDLVDSIRQMVEEQQEVVDDTEPGDDGEAVMISLKQMEVDRISFMLKSYLRVRLQKIERFCLYYTRTLERRSRMSGAEKEFASAYVEQFGVLCEETVLSHLPAPFNKLREDDSLLEPNLDAFVFCQINEDIGRVDLRPLTEREGATTVIDLRKGNQIATRYSAISSFVHDDRVSLI